MNREVQLEGWGAAGLRVFTEAQSAARQYNAVHNSLSQHLACFAGVSVKSLAAPPPQVAAPSDGAESAAGSVSGGQTGEAADGGFLAGLAAVGDLAEPVASDGGSLAANPAAKPAADPTGAFADVSADAAYWDDDASSALVQRRKAPPSQLKVGDLKPFCAFLSFRSCAPAEDFCWEARVGQKKHLRIWTARLTTNVAAIHDTMGQVRYSADTQREAAAWLLFVQAAQSQPEASAITSDSGDEFAGGFFDEEAGGAAWEAAVPAPTPKPAPRPVPPKKGKKGEALVSIGGGPVVSGCWTLLQHATRGCARSPSVPAAVAK